MYQYRRKKILFLLIPITMLFAITAIVMWLWNAILPSIIGIQTVSFWQAMGILVLSKILFGGFRGRFGKNKFGNFQEKMFIERMDSISQEEREKFREKMKERFKNHPFC